MNATGHTRAALGVADYPPGRITGGDRACAGEAFARLQRDVRDLPGRGIDLIEGPFTPGIDLDGVVVAVSPWLDARGGVGVLDAAAQIESLARRTYTEARLPELTRIFSTATRMESAFWQMGLDAAG